MIIPFDKNLIDLAKKLPIHLYAVGGVVRNFLIDGSMSKDIDLAAAISIEDIKPILFDCGFKVVAEYKRTGTIVFTDGNTRAEFTTFRKERYSGGSHVPIETEFTSDIVEDALRRDFKCNAVYYDIKDEKIVDVLGGVEDIKARILDTVTDPDKVFSSDGLRLMRLARFAGELNFKPTAEVLNAASVHAVNIKDISPERIYAELNMILQSDGKYLFSDSSGHYTGLKILDVTRVLDIIIPELADGRGMAQRADFHRYDVLEHSLRSVLYADKKVRLAALLHDVGKPYCFKRDGYYYHHFSEGEKIAERVLKRFKADNATIKKVMFLVREHMIDLDCSVKESKVRKFLVKNYEHLEELLMVKQADFRASLEVEYTAPTLVKWKKILHDMQNDGTPFTLKELNITANELIDIGFVADGIGKELKSLMDYAVLNPKNNVNEVLKKKAISDLKKYIT